MYESKRARRNSKLYRKAGYCALACLTLISCDSVQVKNDGPSTDKIKAHKLLSSGLCTEFSGRGRLKFGKTKERFTYNAILNRKTFSLAIDVPFKGQETLILPLVANANTSGTLYKKISGELIRAKRYKSKKILDDFLKQNQQFFSDIRNVDSNYCDNRCLKGSVKHFSDGRLNYKSEMIGNYSYQANFSQLVANEYKIIQLQGVYQKQDTEKQQRVLSLELIVEACE